MARNPARPLSPHLTIWRWGPHMLVSILHRATGTALALGGGILFIWWLTALAGGEASYARFIDLMTSDATGRLNLIPGLVLFGLTWSFFQHMSTGIRHLLLDTGAGYELKINKMGAVATLVVSTTLTVLVWGAILMRGH
ncbi:succinate dehydrogenase, cytochrome b556 subunit [Sphingomonas sp. BIUV-7]|uniref:Succinate dehydrogenase cytochrome b556 subunit n=1 Tax=Sphingomonas natans TaxID=3063330 RepID=A0ABT8Y482_9SPHN|nr:succinate dehydrogenase, cytochrome b556 subunit [Sphingomonas sp. BIUV-7]MDO6413125.1 succinate dehydrogenase, cytochrome b556 subunit [Sphingomonas sp. BIUV-7]